LPAEAHAPIPLAGWAAIPLAGWAGRQLEQLARETRSRAIAALCGASVLGQRAALNGFAIPGLVSAGGGCRLLRAQDDWIALNLARADDRALLPALLGDADLDPWDDGALAQRLARVESAALLAQGRTLGLAIAAMHETPAAPAIEVLAQGPQRATVARTGPRVLDLSALWAGPLAGHLLWLAGAEVIKVENPRRPDAMRDGDPALFANLNQGKASVAIDVATASGRAALLSLIARADIVIEASRPRALAQLGIAAETLVAAQPGLVWLTITGHGARAPEHGWVGFGDDTAVAGGLTAALLDASGKIGFGGDAPGDPLTGIAAALVGWRAWQGGTAQRIALAMSGVVADALAHERAHDSAALTSVLQSWSRARGLTVPAPPMPPVSAEVRALGADTAQWLSC